MKITMSGLPYSGKGTLRKNLSDSLGLDEFSVGDIRRDYAIKEGISIHELNEKSEKNPKWDKDADTHQQEWAQKHKNFLLEGRLSYFFIPDSIKLFLDVSPNVAAVRAINDSRDSENKCKTIGEQIITNQKRCTSDCIRYFNIYGIKNCYDLNNFDIIIDTSKLTPEQVLRKTIEEIKLF